MQFDRILLRIFTSIFKKLIKVYKYFFFHLYLSFGQGNAGFIERESVQLSSTVWESLQKFTVDSS